MELNVGGIIVATGFDEVALGSMSRKRVEQSKKEPEEDKEELDVPAFIRKKIKS